MKIDGMCFSEKLLWDTYPHPHTHPHTHTHTPPTPQTTLQLSKTLGETSSKWRDYDKCSLTFGPRQFGVPAVPSLNSGWTTYRTKYVSSPPNHGRIYLGFETDSFHSAIMNYPPPHPSK